MLPKEELESYRKAGAIATSCKAWAVKIAKPGMKLLDLAEQVEARIKTEGGLPAFPVNLSQNNLAAHDTPAINDARVIGEKDVLKIDIGVHVNGFIADCAVTVDFSGENTKMLEASEHALKAALALVKDGTPTRKIGAAIEKEIKQRGFNPVYNLTGHGLQQFVGHASPTIPNHDHREDVHLEEDMVIAIEPFATNGKGNVNEGHMTEIFSMQEPKMVRNQAARKILAHVIKTYQTLPFAERWIHEDLKLSDFDRKVGLKELLKAGSLHGYPILKEATSALVSQHETSVIVTKDGCEVLVK